MGSRRSDFGPPNEEILALEMIAREHAKPLDISVSNPTNVGLELPDWGQLLSQNFDPHYRPEPRGLLRAREVLAGHEQKRSTVKLDADDCFLTASTSEAYSFALHALCDPGDAIVVPQPSYPLFDQLAQLAGVRLIHYSIAFDGAWHLDLSSLPSQEVLKREKVRALVVVSPNNPTGNVLRGAEWDALTQVGLPLMVDEVFRPYQHAEGKDIVDPLSQLSPRVPILVFDGLSKRAAAPGLKLGWVWILGEGKAALQQRFEMISDTFLSVASPVQSALPEILKHESASQSAIRARIHESRELLRKRLSETALTWIPSQAGWTEIIRFPSILDESSWWRRLAEAGVLVQAGQLYDLPLSPCFIVSNIAPEHVLADALTRMLAIVNSELS